MSCARKDVKVFAAKSGVALGVFLLLVTASYTFAGSGEPAVGVIESFNAGDALEGWSFSNGAEWPGAAGGLERRGSGGRTGDGVLALRYDFSEGGNYVAAITRMPTERAVQAVRLWVNKPAANKMIFRAVDREGETFQKDVHFDYRGWQQLEVSLDGWVHRWGGDGVFQEPAQQLDILIEGQGGNRLGEVLIDDLQWLFERSGKEVGGVRTATYLESDFGSQDKWGYSGHDDGRYEQGILRYVFDDKSTHSALHWGRSILVRPTAMRLTVASDGSGHELVARCGSHFQLFERSIGVLDATGEQTYEVPLGDMSTWRHFGGEDDGIVRYPIRLEHIRLERKGGQAEGQVRFVRLEVVTEHEPNQTVSLVPRVEQEGDEKLRFSVDLRSLHGESLPGSLHYSLGTLDRTLLSKKVEMSVPPAGKQVSFHVDTAFGEHSMIEGRFQFVAPNTQTPILSTTIARADQTLANYELNPASRIGVGMYLYRFHNHPDDKAWMARMCRLASAAGVKWTREEFHWNWVERVKGEYDFSFFDRLVETATEHGISVYALVCYWTEWNQPPFDDQFIEDYCGYLRVLVGRYKHRIKHWEVWNEPNIFFWPGPKEMYGKLLKRAYETIKEVDPSAQVLGCSTAGIDTNFIKLTMEQGARFDAVTVHPYRHSLDPAAFLRELRGTSELVGGLDVWITEMGWPSNIGGLTERQQAGYVARTYVTSLASKATRTVAWYDFREDGNDPYYNEHHFGLIRNDLTPKIGYRALAAVGQLLGGAEFKRELSLGDDLVGFEFGERDSRTAALWAYDDSIVRLKVDPSDAVVLNAMNERAACARDAGVVTIRLQADMPIYVRADGELRLERLEAPVVVERERVAVHPGDSLRVELRAAADTKVGQAVPPVGWTVEPGDGDRALTVTAPAWTVPGQYAVTVPIRLGGQTFELPVSVKVVPELLRR